MKHSHAAAPAIPPEVEAELVRLGQAISDTQSAIAQAEEKHAILVAEDAKLVAAINENRRTAAIPEPIAVDFAKVDEWHSATRKWAANPSHMYGDPAGGSMKKHGPPPCGMNRVGNLLMTFTKEYRWFEPSRATCERQLRGAAL